MASVRLLIVCILLAAACAQECKLDALEPNDSFNQPTYIQSILALNLTICPANDKDFFVFGLNNTEKVLTFAIGCMTPELKVAR